MTLDRAIELDKDARRKLAAITSEEIVAQLAAARPARYGTRTWKRNLRRLCESRKSGIVRNDVWQRYVQWTNFAHQVIDVRRGNVYFWNA